MAKTSSTGLGSTTVTRGTASIAEDSGLSRVVTYSEPGRWEEYSREVENGCDLVQAVDYTLTQLTAGNADLFIVCDVLRLNGEVKLPGRKITLVARRIVADQPALLDCSGLDAVAVGSRAQNGTVPGEKGQDGARGLDGAPAGSITLAAREILGNLTLKANGGRGAKGQTGGTGSIGVTGRTGSPASNRNRPGNGGQGGQGGQAGSGGAGGDGGQPGDVMVFTVDRIASGLTAISLGGQGGEVGDPGAPGEGGRGGNPGDPCYWSRDNDGSVHGHEPGLLSTNGIVPLSTSCYQPKYHGRQGPSGIPGAAAENRHRSGASAPDKSPRITHSAMATIAAHVSITQLKMIFSRCEIDFASDRKDHLVGQLLWIYEVAEFEKSGSVFYEKRAERTGAHEVGQPSQDELTALRDRAFLLLARLNLGLDLFGLPSNYVGHLSQRMLEHTSNKHIENALSIEAACDEYLSKRSTLQDLRDPLLRGLEHVEQSQASATQKASEYDVEADKAQDEVLQLSASIQDIARQLELADRDFRAAVESAGGCSLLDMIQFVAGVIAVCYGVYAGYMALADSMSKLNSPDGLKGKNVLDDLKLVGETFEGSGINDHFSAMKQGYLDVKEALEGGTTKIVVSLEAFEAQLQPYLNLDAARIYRDLMRRLVDVSKARNERQLAYTQFLIKAIDLRAEAVSLQSEASRVSRLIAATNNPALTECAAHLVHHLSVAKRIVLETLDLQRRSLVYLTLVGVKPQYRWDTIATLQAAQMRYDHILTEELESQGREKGLFQPIFTLMRRDNHDTFASLAAGKEVALSIPSDHPEFNRGGTSFVTVRSVGIVAEGISSRSGRFTFRLTHMGNPLLWDQHGRLMNFIHSRRSANLTYQRENGKWAIVDEDDNLGGSDRFLHLSPIATWTLRITEDQDRVDLSNVDALSFVFKGEYLPSETPSRMGAIMRKVSMSSLATAFEVV